MQQSSSLKYLKYDDDDVFLKNLALRGNLSKTRHIRVKSSINVRQAINRVKILLMSGYQKS